MSRTDVPGGTEAGGAPSEHRRVFREQQLLAAAARVERARRRVAHARDELDRAYEAQVQAAGSAGAPAFALAEVADIAHLNAMRRDLAELKAPDSPLRALDWSFPAPGRREHDGDTFVDLAAIDAAERDLADAEHELAVLRRATDR